MRASQSWTMPEPGALRWLVDEQAMPAVMWLMVALSTAVGAAIAFLLLVRLLPGAATSGRRVCDLLDLATEVGPLCGIFGTVVGLVCSLHSVGKLDARSFLVDGLRTALFTTGYGVVIALVAMVALFLLARRDGGGS